MPADNLRQDRNLHNLYSEERISQNHWHFVAKESLARYQGMMPESAERFKKVLVENQLLECTKQFVEKHPYLINEDIDRHHPNGTQLVLEGDFYVYTPEELQELITKAYDRGMLAANGGVKPYGTSERM